MVGNRLAAEDELLLDELVYLLIGVVGTVLLAGLVTGRITRIGIIVIGAIVGVLIIVAFMLEQRLRDQLQTAENCRCSAYHGDGS